MSEMDDDMPSNDDLLRFEWSVRALAQEASVQFALFPAFACVADELALEFDEYHRKLPELSFGFSDEQEATIQSLDDKLEMMSGPRNSALWTDEALLHSSEWREVRKLARQVLAQMGWTTMSPPPDRAIYVGPDA